MLLCGGVSCSIPVFPTVPKGSTTSPSFLRLLGSPSPLSQPLEVVAAEFVCSPCSSSACSHSVVTFRMGCVRVAARGRERERWVAGGSSGRHTCFNVTQSEGENMPLIAQQGAHSDGEGDMAWQRVTKTTTTYKSSCVLLACCSRLSLAASGQSAAKCSFRFASPIGSTSDDQVFYFFELVIFVPSVLHVPFVFRRVAAHIPANRRNMTAGNDEKHLLYSGRSAESHAVSRALWQFFKPNTRSLNGDSLHSSFLSDVIITLRCATWPCGETFSSGSQEERRSQRKVCGECFPLSCPTAARASGGIGGELPLAFLMSWRRPFSSAKINIWPLVVPLCLIRGHPGLHIQELIDPENFIQSNSRPEQLCSPPSRLFLTQMFKWHWNYLLINCVFYALTLVCLSVQFKNYSCFELCFPLMHLLQGSNILFF